MLLEIGSFKGRYTYFIFKKKQQKQLSSQSETFCSAILKKIRGKICLEYSRGLVASDWKHDLVDWLSTSSVLLCLLSLMEMPYSCKICSWS